MNFKLRFLLLGILIGIILIEALLIILVNTGIATFELGKSTKADNETNNPSSNTTVRKEKLLKSRLVKQISPYETSSDKQNIETTVNKKNTEKLTIKAVGDILLDRGPESKVKKYGYDYLFKEIVEPLSEADLTFANLESPTSFLGKPYRGKPKIVTFRAEPSMLFGIKYSGIDIVSLANNHISDYGSKSLSETIDLLNLLDIKFIGAGKNIEEARTPLIINKKGYKLAFLGYAEAIWSTDEATEKKGGSVHFELDTVLEDIRNTKAEHNPDFIFISIHWGIEHKNKPRDSDRDKAHSIIDAGADVILGHHPHVLQSIETYNEGIIFYSLGNFIFDMKSKKTYKSIIAELTLRDRYIDKVRLIPVEIIRKKYYPTIATGETATETLENLSSWSKDYNTKISIENEEGLIYLKEKPKKIHNTKKESFYYNIIP